MKCQGWEKKLDDYLQSQRAQPFVWGSNDCVLFAAKAAIVQGVDVVKHIEGYGKYDKAKAVEILRNNGNGLSDLFDRAFKRRHPVSCAMRGDVALVEVDGVKAVGVIDGTGRNVAVKTASGLRHIAVSKIIMAWGVE